MNSFRWVLKSLWCQGFVGKVCVKYTRQLGLAFLRGR